MEGDVNANNTAYIQIILEHTVNLNQQLSIQITGEHMYYACIYDIDQYTSVI